MPRSPKCVFLSGSAIKMLSHEIKSEEIRRHLGEENIIEEIKDNQSSLG
jgi:hypothetical protein